MRNEEIQRCVLDTLITCGIHSFPIDCFHIIQQYNFKIMKYSELSTKKYQACMELSEDSCLIGDTLYYNDDSISTRIRFSIMHELGHYLLNSQAEIDANKFASYILAPRMAIHYANCKNFKDVAKLFDLSSEAAEYAFDDYRRWHRIAVYKMSELDKAMYKHFYNQEAKKFVYKEERCYGCGSMKYNGAKCSCPSLWRDFYVYRPSYDSEPAFRQWFY